MIILSTVPLDSHDVEFISSTVLKRHDLLDDLKELGDSSVSTDSYMRTIRNDRFNIQIQDFNPSDTNYLIYVHPTSKVSSLPSYNYYEYQYSYEFSYDIPERYHHARVIDNPIRYWKYLNSRKDNDTWVYESLDEFWMRDIDIDLDKVEGMPDLIRDSLERSFAKS